MTFNRKAHLSKIAKEKQEKLRRKLGAKAYSEYFKKLRAKAGVK